MYSAFCGSLKRILAVCLLLLIYADGTERRKKVCSSIDIRNNVAYFDKFADCTIVDGFVQIVLLDKTSENDFANVSFSELREITQYLLVYRVKGLKSLGQLFPNLALIRGTVLFANTALAIYRNPRLQEVGLRSLTHIMEGSVIIHNNPNLCFANSIDWGAIMKLDKSNRTYYEVFIDQNKETRECNNQEVCKSSGCDGNLCWSRDHCQLLHLDNCHPLCAGGCYENYSAYDCYACKGLVAADGKCVSSCPPGSYEYLKTKCITDEQCRNITSISLKKDSVSFNYFTFDGSCIDECPRKYHKSKNGTTCVLCDNGSCYKQCVYKNKIGTVSASRILQSCTHIKGSLEIEIKTGNYSEGIENALENNLGEIEEISGQLKIIHSHALVSLNFLRKLRIIRGENVNSTQHSLIVKDNKNLQQLWDWSQKPNGRDFTIKSGKILFHFNPKLCLTEIDELVHVANLPEYNYLEVSQESNGYLAACSLVTLNVTVEKRESNSVILAIHQSPKVQLTSDYISRFIIFYRENTDRTMVNQTVLYEHVSECGDSQWKMRDVSNPNAIILTQLESDVQYVFFVKTYTTASSIGTSPLQYVTTLPAQPSTPLEFAVNYTTESEAILTWKHPSHPHGRLTHYKIRGFFQTDENSDMEERDYCKYKMSKMELTIAKPVVTTTPIPNVENDSCKCDNETEKENMEQLCNNFEHKTDFNVKDFENSGLEICDTFIYSVMNANYLMLRDLDEIEPQMDSIYSDQITVNHNDDVFPTKNSTGLDGKYDTFITEVPVGTNTVKISNLRHFSEYIILISACRERLLEESVDAKSCSRESFLVIRTERHPMADTIKDFKIVTNNQTTNISWNEPTFVNSFIHSYQLEYRSSDTEYSKFVELCITAKEFRARNFTYVLDNLPTGHYVIRVKAISLAGDGPYIVSSIHISEQIQNYMTIIGSSLVAVFAILLILIGFLYYWRSQIIKNRILFASVNPRYEPVYIEDHWEVPRENLTIIKQLGRGVFGTVHEGILEPDHIRCAVKTTVNFKDDINAFLKEATLMKEFHNAYHIVRLLGVISQGSPVYVIMELMERGDLKSYLVKNGRELADSNGTLPFDIVFKMTLEIADGMAFLEAKKFVHRDLAARNCMVSADGTIKIGDFGLARDIYETDYYRKGDRGTLPIKWMAPESIRDGVFTSHSDVWSYGVVLWEIITLAQMPYHPQTNEEVIRYVQSGQILDIGVKCHQTIRLLMLSCWKWQPSERPKFTQILRFIDTYATNSFKRVSYFHNGECPGSLENVIPYDIQTEYYPFTNDSDADDDTSDCEDDTKMRLTVGNTFTSSNSPPAKYYSFNTPHANGHVKRLA